MDHMVIGEGGTTAVNNAAYANLYILSYKCCIYICICMYLASKSLLAFQKYLKIFPKTNLLKNICRYVHNNVF